MRRAALPFFWSGACAALSIAIMSTPGAARAVGPSARRVAVLRLEVQGDIAEAAGDLFAARLVEGLASAGFEVFAGAAVASRLAEGGPSPAGCRDSACYPAVARALGVRYLVSGNVVGRDKNYDIMLELIDGGSGGSIGQKRESCELCGIEEAAEKMGLAVAALRERLESSAKRPARFILRSRPTGAKATIDGKSHGRTPIDVELAAGAHQLRLAADGYEPSERTFTVVNGVDETLDLDLVPQPERFPFKRVGIAAVAVGAATLIAGVVAVSMDDQQVGCSAAMKDPAGQCPYLYDTAALGAALTGVGAACLAIGGMAVYLGSVGGVRRASETANPRGERAYGVFAGRHF